MPAIRLCKPTQASNKTGTVYGIEAPIGPMSYAPLFPPDGRVPYRFRTPEERDAKLESVNTMLLNEADSGFKAH